MANTLTGPGVNYDQIDQIHVDPGSFFSDLMSLGIMTSKDGRRCNRISALKGKYFLI